MIGQLLAVACGGDRELLARIGGSLGDAAREAAEELHELTGKEQRKVRARIVAAASAPVPAGIRGVHPSWIEAGLVGLPMRARMAIANSAHEPVDVWLVRWALAEIPPLPAIDPELVTPGSIDDTLRLSGDALVHWLGEVGADQLAHALSHAGIAAVTAVASRVVGERLIAAAVRIAASPRVGALGPTRAAIRRCRGALHGELAIRTPRDSDGHADTHVARATELAPTLARAGIPEDDLLVRIGARALANRVDGLARRQLAVRLPRPLGLAVREELVAHAGTPLDHSPTWSALAAPW